MLKSPPIKPMRASAGQGALSSGDGERVRLTVLFAVITVSILLVLWPTTRSMIETWQRSSTYGHCYVVIPLAIWMAWRKSLSQVGMPARPYWPGLAVIAAICFVWLLGELASAAIVSQFSAVAVIAATTLTVLGWQSARQLAFPLGFLFFAVPFGDELLPLLMDWTADVTVGALRATGIPVHREGTHFVIPSGSWSVIEACSGVRYLIAALMTGCLFAWLQYRSPAKRAAFVLLALAAALVANWLRAYTVVLVGHLSDNRIGPDHNFLGWLIFGAVMFVLFAFGVRWTDRDDHQGTQADASRARPLTAHTIVPALVASLLTTAVWPAAAEFIAGRLDARPIWVEAMDTRDKWQHASVAASPWAPELVGQSAVSVQTFVRDEVPVGVYLGIYRNQKQGAELVSTMNRVVSTDIQRWRLIESGSFEVPLNGDAARVRTALVQGPGGRVLIWHWYWLAGHTSGSDVRIKLQLALQRLTGASDTAAWVAVYTPVDENLSAGVRRLNAFVEAMSGSIDSALQRTARQ